MKRFGLIGHPIGHSLSPALFRAGYEGRYTYDLIETPDFEEAYRRFLEGYDGINVTAPFKELAFEKADILSEECRLIKATNLMVKTPDGVKAYNSDYLGVRMWLQEISAEGQQERRVLIAGCGGAGKAAALAAASLGFRLHLMNRDKSKAEGLADSVKQLDDKVIVEISGLDEFCRCFRESDIIIYNIPTAIPQLRELCKDDFIGVPDSSGQPHEKHILEASYKSPSFTENLIDRMKKCNPEASYTRGEKWLLYQALTGYKIFTGERPYLPSMQSVL